MKILSFTVAGFSLLSMSHAHAACVLDPWPDAGTATLKRVWSGNSLRSGATDLGQQLDGLSEDKRRMIAQTALAFAYREPGDDEVKQGMKIGSLVSEIFDQDGTDIIMSRVRIKHPAVKARLGDREIYVLEIGRGDNGHWAFFEVNRLTDSKGQSVAFERLIARFDDGDESFCDSEFVSDKVAPPKRD